MGRNFEKLQEWTSVVLVNRQPVDKIIAEEIELTPKEIESLAKEGFVTDDLHILIDSVYYILSDNTTPLDKATWNYLMAKAEMSVFDYEASVFD